MKSLTHYNIYISIMSFYLITLCHFTSNFTFYVLFYMLYHNILEFMGAWGSVVVKVVRY